MTHKVALYRCDAYDRKKINHALDQIEEGLDLWNGPIPKTDRVLLKPNLISAKIPEKAVTTHPLLVELVAKRLKKKGYEVFIGDSPGGALRGLDRYWTKSGLKAAAQNSGATLVNFESSSSSKIRHNGREYSIASPVLDFDFIINMPKLKTHHFAGLTGAVKNLFGVVPGLKKANTHLEAPKPDDFAKRMLDIYEIAKPTFHLADGIMVMDTKGPTSGRVRPLNCLVASFDGVALDGVFAYLAGCKVKGYLTGIEAQRRGYAGVDMENIRVVGEDPDSIKPTDFKVPNIAIFRFIPGFMGKIFERLIWAWPVSLDHCTGCKFCADACPAKAIEIKNKRAYMDPNKCFLCLCCHELCPEEAVEIRQSFIARRLFH